LQGASSSKFSGTSGGLPDFVFHTPVVISHVSHLPIIENPINSELGNFLVEYSTCSLDLKEEKLESFDFLVSPEIVKWFRLESLEYLSFLGSPSPHYFKFTVTKEEETSISIDMPPYLSKSQPPFVKFESSPPYTHPFSKLHVIHITSLPVKSRSTFSESQSLPFPNQMAGINPPQN
jgi:hypothetical protein